MTLQMKFQEKIEEGIEIGAEIAKLETARKMLDSGEFSLEAVAVWSGLPLEKVQEIAGKQS